MMFRVTTFSDPPIGMRIGARVRVIPGRAPHRRDGCEGTIRALGASIASVAFQGNGYVAVELWALDSLEVIW